MESKFAASDLQRLAGIVREVTGNQVLEKNFSMLESRMKTHLLHLGISSMVEYWSYYSKNETQENEVLQSLMTTHHTFFFREFAHFEVLQQWISENLVRIKERFESTKVPLRIWSAASSRGQEAYSIAMYLEAELLKKHGIEYVVFGTDLDKESVSYAKNGVYPLRDVNAIPRQYLSNLWKMGTGSVKEFAAVGAALRRKVYFETLNLFETKFWKPTEKFDVIFCRNVFIYFSEADVKNVALELASRLDSDGLFVSGISEPLRFSEWTLKNLGSNCYQKITGRAQSGSLPVVKPEGILGQSEVSVEKEVRYRVLAVDDSPTIHALLKKIFSQDSNCMSVETAINGQEAAEKLKAGKFDLITLDIHMPVMSGIEFLEKVYDKKKHPPVIMVSSVNRTDMDLATKAISLGAFDYVEKPAMNNLQKSSTEILTKTKMALRRVIVDSVEDVKAFESTISQKIVIPDASQCLRVIFSNDKDTRALEQVVKAQNAESRSPAVLIVWKDVNSIAAAQAESLRWTQRKILSARPSDKMFRPNHFYFISEALLKEVYPSLRLRSVSIQILDPQVESIHWIAKTALVQVLVDESLGWNSEFAARKLGHSVSDMTPATSFASLSGEFFANLRKSAA